MSHYVLSSIYSFYMLLPPLSMSTGGVLNLHYSGNTVNSSVLQLSIHERKMSYVVSTPQHAIYSVYICPCSYVLYTTGGALPAVLAGAVVAFLFFTLFIAGIIVGAVLLGRKLHRKRILSQRNAPQQKGSITKSSEAAKEDEGTEIHTYDVVGDDTSIYRRAVLYQELNTGNLDYVSEYTELRGGTYQELDLKSREEEHLYQQKAN